MASSGRLVLAAALSLVVLATACGGEAKTGPTTGATATPVAPVETQTPGVSPGLETGPTATAVPAGTPTDCEVPGAGCPPTPRPSWWPDHPPGASASEEVIIGPEIGAGQAEFKLQTRDGEGFQEPWAAWLDTILLVTYPRSFDTKEVKTYEIWRPQTGTFEEAWRTPAGMQDLLLDQSGDWFLTLRTDHHLGSPVWELILRNLQSGEARTLAQGNQEVAKVPGLPWRLPYGLGADGSISGDTVVWVEFYLDSTGSPGRRIQLYDITSQETSTLASSADVFSEQLWSPSIGEQRVAWMHLQTNDSPNEIILFDLATEASRSIPVAGDVYMLSLSADGRFLAWDDSLKAKYALDLETDEQLQYAGDEGWGTLRSDRYMSWIPGSAFGGAAGFYDLENRVVRFVPWRENVGTNLGQVMGDWFVWQELDRTVPDNSNSYWYLMRLED